MYQGSWVETFVLSTSMFIGEVFEKLLHHEGSDLIGE